LRKNFVPASQDSITMHFRENGSRGYRPAARIAVNKRALLHRKINRDRINQQEIGPYGEPLNGTQHRKPGGLIDIDLIDFERVRASHSPTDSAPFYLSGKHFTFFRAYNFAVAQTANGAVRVENDSGGKYRPEKAATANFINARNPGKTGFSSFALVRADATDAPRLRVFSGTFGAPAFHLPPLPLGAEVRYSRSRRRAALPLRFLK
jgi:hypothetical protein